MEFSIVKCTFSTSKCSLVQKLWNASFVCVCFFCFLRPHGTQTRTPPTKKEDPLVQDKFRIAKIDRAYPPQKFSIDAHSIFLQEHSSDVANPKTKEQRTTHTHLAFATIFHFPLSVSQHVGQNIICCRNLSLSSNIHSIMPTTRNSNQASWVCPASLGRRWWRQKCLRTNEAKEQLSSRWRWCGELLSWSNSHNAKAKGMLTIFQVHLNMTKNRMKPFCWDCTMQPVVWL